MDAPGTVAQLYPEHDFASMGQVAFTVQTVVDHLLTVPQVDKTRIAITGYSRAGKMALIAAALDDRIAAVIAGSTGVGGVTPWRLSGEYGMGEGVESTTRSFPQLSTRLHVGVPIGHPTRSSRSSTPATPCSPSIRPDSAAAWGSSPRSTNGIPTGP